MTGSWVGTIWQEITSLQPSPPRGRGQGEGAKNTAPISCRILSNAHFRAAQTLVFVFLATMVARPGAAQDDSVVVVKAGTIIPVTAEPIERGIILIRNGKIEAVGPADEVAIPDGYRVLDGRKRWVIPGLVDFHSHVAGDLSDLNDGVYLTNPDLRTVETLTPNNEYVQDARAAGVTSMLLIPGSGNNMAGFGTLCKSAGRTTDERECRL